MKYIIEITETLQKQIEVEAQNESEAIKLIKEKYKNEEIILTEQDFIDYEIDIIRQPEYIEIYKKIYLEKILYIDMIILKDIELNLKGVQRKIIYQSIYIEICDIIIK